MDSSTALCNVALSHLGISKEIGDVLTEKSAEASACRRFLTQVFEEVLRDMKPPFSTQIKSLALIEEEPNSEWAYSYRYPSGCLFFIRILSGLRNDSRSSRIPYKISKDDQGKIILTDVESAECEYVSSVTDVTQFSPDLAMAASLLLASYIAPRITGGDPFKVGARALQLYNYSFSKAAGNAYSEQQDEEPTDAESILARG
jgi:hypothetical protein